jgi:uncharacterized caspase-like protein
LKIFDLDSMKTILKLFSPMKLNLARFSIDGSKIITISDDIYLTFWDSKTGAKLFTQVEYWGGHVLVYDNDFRFDGCEHAVNSIYFVCGTEILELNQLKNSLWVPDLANRVMNGEKINSTKISELDICDRVPIVEQLDDSGSNYSYLIKPRRGGIGNVIISMNGGAYTKVVKPYQLIKLGSNFVLKLPKKEIKKYLKSGESNSITVTANTSDNVISSRGEELTVEEENKTMAVPNIYGVFIGISNYKGKRIDLKYASKDAEDLANSFDVCAKEMMKKLEKDTTQNHVFTYKLNTNESRTAFPDKNTIYQTLIDIGKKTNPNDILLVFFAGHGVIQGDAKKQFYFLTADASSTQESAKIVGISTEELTEWLKPENNKAQKRILIFDACQSGQAINNLVKIGDNSQNYLTARGDEDGQRKKNIDKLNEQTGFFILSAAASNQSAYEMGRYQQGLLTYSLLKTMQQDPSILDLNNQLDVSKWFNASQEIVKELSRKNFSSKRQDPQIVSSNSFKVGVVNDLVRKSIHLSDEKPIFTRSEFRNNALRVDNLKLRNMIDKEISDFVEEGVDKEIAFSSDYQGADGYTISGDYSIKDKEIEINVMLIKGGTEPVHNYIINGNLDELIKLTEGIVNDAILYLKSIKK